MELVKLISKYDPVLRFYIKNCTTKYLNNLNKCDGKKNGRGNMISYLSKNMYSKIIDIIRKSIQDKICEEVKLANFFSLEVDSTQDVSVTDQLCICLRYVNNNTFCERILSMISLENSTGVFQS